MSQFCTRCGKPLQPGVRFCPACGGAVVTPATSSQNPSATAATEFTPVTAVPAQQVASSGTQATSGSNDSWATVTAPDVPAPAQPSAFSPVDVPATPEPAGDPPHSQGWAQVAPPDLPPPNGTSSTAAPSQQGSGQQGSFAPVAFAAAPPTSTPSQQWSQPAPSSTPNQQWSQSSPNGFPPATPLNAAAQPPRRSILPKLIGIALVLILLVGAAVVGGVVYVGYKVRQKARAVSQSFSRLANDKSLNLPKGTSPDAKVALQSLMNALNATGPQARTASPCSPRAIR